MPAATATTLSISANKVAAAVAAVVVVVVVAAVVVAAVVVVDCCCLLLFVVVVVVVVVAAVVFPSGEKHKKGFSRQRPAEIMLPSTPTKLLDADALTDHRAVVLVVEVGD